MRAFARHGLIRFATLFLLAWITVDLTWPDACAGDVLDVNGASACMSHNDAQGPQHAGLLHQDHCFCHAHSITLAADLLIAAPALSSALDPTGDVPVPATSAASLYHPPPFLL